MAIFKSDNPTAELVKRVQSFTEQAAALEIAVSKAEREEEAALVAAGHAALDLENGKITRKEYDALAGKAQGVANEKQQKSRALVAVREELARAKQALFAAKAEDRGRDAAVLGNQRLKAVTEYVEAMQAAWKARRALHTANEKIAQTFGAAILLNSGGTLLGDTELQIALEAELARLTADAPVIRCPVLPGTGSSIMGNPAKEIPLAVKMTAANTLLVKRAVAGGELPRPKPAPAPVAQAPDEDDALLDLPSGTRVSAEQVMATRGRVKMA